MLSSQIGFGIGLSPQVTTRQTQDEGIKDWIDEAVNLDEGIRVDTLQKTDVFIGTGIGVGQLVTPLVTEAQITKYDEIFDNPVDTTYKPPPPTKTPPPFGKEIIEPPIIPFEFERKKKLYDEDLFGKKKRKKKGVKGSMWFPASLESVTFEEFALGGKRATHIASKQTSKKLFKELIATGRPIPTKKQYAARKKK